jgi:hypothetical protein
MVANMARTRVPDKMYDPWEQFTATWHGASSLASFFLNKDKSTVIY